MRFKHTILGLPIVGQACFHLGERGHGDELQGAGRWGLVRGDKGEPNSSY